MDDAFIQSLLKQFQGIAEHRYRYTPNYATDPQKFVGKLAPSVSEPEAALTELIHGNHVNGATNRLTGKRWVNPDSMTIGTDPRFDQREPYDLMSVLETVLHENYHARRGELPMTATKALRDRSEEMFGGKKQYEEFLEKIKPESIRNSIFYSIQHNLGLVAPEEEILAFVVGGAGVNNDRSNMNEALAKVHPKGPSWLDMQLDALDTLKPQQKAPKLNPNQPVPGEI